MTDFSSLTKAFRIFASAAHETSPLYERLSLAIADDLEILSVIGATPKPDHAPNLLFAAMRFLNFGDFASIPASRTFVLANAAAIQQIMATRRVQTNEVGRSSYLLPAFARVAQMFEGQALAIIEIGASAGLLLNWDRYAYQYGADKHCGSPTSPVKIACEVRSASSPLCPLQLPRIDYRIGIDLHTVDVGIEDERRWLESLVWPEEIERATRLAAAIAVQREHPVRLIEGDGLNVLPALLGELPETVLPCVFHTAVMYQLAPKSRDTLAQILADYGATRDLVRLSAESNEDLIVHTEVTAWERGRLRHEVLSRSHPHGRWMEWLR
jgi:hypothetical protein